MTRVNNRLLPSRFQSPPPYQLNCHDEQRVLSVLQELVSPMSLFTSCVFCVLRINVFFQLFESCFIKGNNFEQNLEAYRNNCMGIDV